MKKLTLFTAVTIYLVAVSCTKAHADVVINASKGAPSTPSIIPIIIYAAGVVALAVIAVTFIIRIKKAKKVK